MVPPERLKPTASISSQVDSTGIIHLFGHCIATWYAMSPSYLKLMEILDQFWAWLDSDQKAD